MEIGKLDIHGQDSDDWFERFELYCLTNDKITDTNKVAYLLTQAGGETYSLVKDLAFPTAPKDLSYDEIKCLLLDHLKPRRFTLKERAIFNTLVRKQGQDVKEFIRTLQKQASKCGFEENLEDQLRDRLLAGINDTNLQKRMLLEDSLTFSRAREICETAASIQSALDDSQSVLLARSNRNITKGRPHGKIPAGNRRHPSPAVANKSQTDPST